MNRGDLDESFLTVAEVAQVLKLNQQTVRNWIDQGSLPALRVGRRVRIRRSDFERLLDQSSIAGAGSLSHEDGPSAEDFWGGEPVGQPEPRNEPLEQVDSGSEPVGQEQPSGRGKSDGLADLERTTSPVENNA